jgi:hypothetical protein
MESPGWGRKKEDRDRVIKWYKDYIKNVVAGQKFNMLCLGISNQLILNNPGLITTRSFINKEQYLEITEFCREHFVKFIPALETVGVISTGFQTVNSLIYLKKDLQDRQMYPILIFISLFFLLWKNL